MSQEHSDQLKRALATLQDLRAKLVSVEKKRTEPIAIIGMACRFPGAGSVEEFWQLLLKREDAIQPINRWREDAIPNDPADASGKSSVRYGGLLRDIDQFDPYFFGISPREAAAMDPQQRILLEVAWEALQDAGQTVEHLAASATGVFVGAHSHSSDYYLLQAAEPDSMDIYTGTGTAHNVLSGRLAFCFDLRGPNFTVDTACSSSLVAVHLACQSLRTGESSVAIAAGVNAILSPHFTLAASHMNMLASDGHCKTFDASADGFVRSEGCGVVILKRLSDALADGDNILATIRGSAINQDGHTNGLTAPNGLAQQAVIRQALENANVAPSQIGYVETHGTGTPLGDPIEVEALGLTVGKPSSDGQVCVLGAVKSNIGHLEGAAGIAGLVKTVLVLQHGTIPANVAFQTLNPHISLADTRLVIADRERPWHAAHRFAGVSSFGWSGTNAHVVLEQAPPRVEPNSPAPADAYYLLPLSARSREALQSLAPAYADYLSRSDASLADICFSASVRASHHEYRLAVGGSSRGELVQALESFQPSEERAGLSVAAGRKQQGLVFVFPGQGSQWLGMGQQLLATEPVFRDALEQCQQAFAPYVDWSLPEQLTADSTHSRLSEIDVIQPMLMAIQVALAALWRSWGIEPDAVVGHSMGEVAAAHVAGALSLRDAAQIICLRSQLLKRIRGRGAMLLVELSMDKAQVLLRGYEERVSIAVSNSARSTVLSGDPAALSELQMALEGRDIFCRTINVDVAAHSPQVEPLSADLLRGLANIRPQRGTVPMFSTVTAGMIDGRELTAEYWVRNLREPVQFSSIVNQLVDLDHTLFIEASPHPVLLPAIEHSGVITLPSMRRNEAERKVLLDSFGELYTLGKAIRWQAVVPPGNPVRLPAYPWQHERFWLQEINTDPIHHTIRAAQATESENSLSGAPLDLANPTGGTVRENTLDSRRFPALYEHRLHGAPVMSASAYLAIAKEALQESLGDEITLDNVEFKRALPLDDKATRIQLWLTPMSGSSTTLELYSHRDGKWQAHLDCQASATQDPRDARGATEQEGNQAYGLEQIHAIRSASTVQSSGADYYQTLAKNGIQIGSALRRIRHLWQTANKVLAELHTETEQDPAQDGIARLDACFQLLASFSAKAGEIDTPIAIHHIHFYGAFESAKWAYGKRAGETSVDLYLLNSVGAPVVEIQGVELVKWQTASPPSVMFDDWLYELQWQLAPSNQTRVQEEPGTWLLLEDTSGVGAELRTLLEQQEQHCIPVRLKDFAEHAHTTSLASALEQLIPRQAAVDGRDTPLRGLIHLVSLDSTLSQDTTPAMIEQAQRQSCGTALTIVQALARRDWQQPPRLWLVTRGAQAVSGDQPLNFLQAPLWGFGHTVAEEHNEVWGGLIDLDPIASAAESAAQIRVQVMQDSADDRVAFRQGKRFVARLRRFGAHPVSRPYPLKQDAAYLITGGSGGVGLALARWAVDRGARHLVLMARTPLPRRNAWGQINDGRVLTLVRTIQELEAKGARVHYAQVDITDQVQLAEFLEKFHRETGLPIAAVFHAANLFENQLVTRLTTDSLVSVMRPKLTGGWLLHHLLGDADMVFFSSIAGLFPQPGQAAYAAANAGLDALAAYRRAQGKKVWNMDWGIWQGVGSLWKAMSGQRAADQLMEQGISSFTQEQGLAILGRLMEGDARRAIVMPVDWRKFKNSPTGKRNQMFLAEFTAETSMPQPPSNHTAQPPVSALRDQLVSVPVEQRQSRFEAYLQEQIGRVLRMPASRIDPHLPLGSYGLDSLMAIELRNRLDNALDLKLSATIVWNYPTVSDLAVYLAKKLEIPLADGGLMPAQQNVATHTAQSERNQGIAAIESLSDRDALKALRQKQVNGGRK